MSYAENAKKMKVRIDADRETVATLEASGGMKVVKGQSDKIGFDREQYFVNDILVKSVYVKQEIPMGTADNPIVWKETMQLIQNAYYIFEGVRKVWTGEAGAVASWDDKDWEVF